MPQNDHQAPRRQVTGIFPPNPPAPFVELGVTTAFSFLRGASDAADLVLAAHALGYDAVGVADLNSLAGVVRMHCAAERAGMRAVIGARIALVDGTAFLAYPRDRAAYGRLSRLISKGRRQRLDGGWQDKGACDLSLDDLAAHAEGLALVWLPPEDGDPGALAGLAARLPGLGHVAASFLYRGDDRARINRLDRAARAVGLSLLASNDVHYHAPDRRPLQDIMTCIRHKTTIQQAGHLLHPNAERHLKSPAEMARLFADWPHAIAATRALADACTFSLRELRYEYPRETVPAGRTPDQQLAHLAAEGAAARYPAGVPAKVAAAIAHELAIIAAKKIAPYFLTINDIVAHARAQGILCQGRGSAANSAVCFVLGITPVDPAHHDLLFERFISEDRDEPPDIDVDFEHERREEVIQHIYRTYTRERAGLCATVIHYRPRSAIREVGRAMGLTEDVTAALAGTVWGSWGDRLEHAAETGLDLTDRTLAMTIRLAEQMIGMPRHLSQHVGGFILTEGPLTETVPIGNGAMPERSFIEWDKDDIDALGILKVDVLALGMLTCIRKCFDLIAAHHGRRLTLADLNPAAPDAGPVFQMLCRGDSIGVFQVESRAQMNMLPRMKPKEFYDLVIEVAIVRPGPIQGDMVHPYLRRRNEQEAVEYPRPGPQYPQDELEKILKRTLGVPIFQEQAMKIALDAAQFSSAEANELRRAMATFRSRGTIELLQDKMVGRMIARGYDPDFARRCFDQIKGFGEYGFPESHAAAFAHLVYVSAWLKHYYPAAFAAALLNSQPMGFYAPAQIVRDAQVHGVEVRAADVNFSDWDNMLEPDGTAPPRPAQPAPLAEPVPAPRDLILPEGPPAPPPALWPDEALAPPRPRLLAGRAPWPFCNGQWQRSLPAAAHGRAGGANGPGLAGPGRLGTAQRGPAGTVPGGHDTRAMDPVPPPPSMPALSGSAVLPPATGFALRLGLRQIGGFAETMARRIEAARNEPFEDMDALHRRTGIDARAIRLIAAADAARSMGLDRRAALWQARGLRDAPPLPLFAAAGEGEGDEPAVTLPAMPVCEHVVADYQTTRLSLKAHPMAFLRRSMAAQGYVTAAGLAGLRNRQTLRMGGVVLIRQRPGSAKGVCFITIEDETGVANLVVWPTVFEAFRAVVMGARLLVVEGQIQRSQGITHVVARCLSDRTDALGRLSGEALDPALARADESNRPPIHPPVPHPGKAGPDQPSQPLTAEARHQLLTARPSPAGHPRDHRILPPSRDFH